VSEVLSVKRLWLLIRSDLVGDYRSLIMVCATLAGIMLLASMLTVAQGNQVGGYYTPWYMGMLFIWGSINASYAFRELHDKTKNEAYLILPASALEKTLARLFRVTIAFFVFLLVFLTVISAVIEGVNWLVFGRANGIFNVAEPSVWQPVGVFLVTVSLYFLGAAWFRRLHFVKTALTLTVIAIGLMCFGALIFGLVFGDFSEMSEPSIPGSAFRSYYLAHEGLFDALQSLVGILYFIGLPIFCWWVAYLRVKETEVSHGV
jgi:hypothetical protein